MTPHEVGVAATAAALGMTRSAVRKAIVRGVLRAELVDGSYVVERSEIERYRAEHRKPRKEAG